MIKLSLVKKFGIKLVSGDSFEGIRILMNLANTINNSDDYNEVCVESFATRLISDGIPTSIDGDVVLEVANWVGTKCNISARNVVWHAWVTWRPSMEWLVQQYADKPVTYKDDTHHFGEDVQVDLHNVTYVPEGFVRSSAPESAEPIFTQAMADAGELPPVGAECQIMLDGYWQTCFMVGLSKSGNPVIQMGVHCIESIGCDYKPLDTRTEKQKAVDQVITDIGMDDELLTYPSTVIAKMIGAGLLK